MRIDIVRFYEKVAYQTVTVPESGRLADVFERYRNSCLKTCRQIDLRTFANFRSSADTVEQGQFLQTTK